MFAAYALELAEPPGLLDYALQGPPPNPDNNKPWRSLVESRSSGSFWTYIAISEVTGKWEEAFGTVTEGTPLDALTRTARRAWNGTALVSNTKVDWQPGDGLLKVFATPIADVLDGLVNHHRGPTAPPWARPGTTWDDDSGAPTSVVFKKMDAAGTWRALGVMNETTGGFTPSGGPFLPIAGGTLTGDLHVAVGANKISLTGDGGIEVVRAAGGPFIDFKDNAGDDFDVRFQQTGANALTITAAGGVSTSHGLTVPGASSFAGVTASGTITANGNPALVASQRISAPSLFVGNGPAAPAFTIHSRGSGAGVEAGTVAIENQAAASYAIARFITGSRHWYAGTDNLSNFVITDNTIGAARLRIDTSGGITIPGVVSPQSGIADIAGLAGFTIYNAGNPAIQMDASDTLFYNRAGNYYAFFIGGSEIARIDSSGFVGLPFKKFQADGANQAGLQVTGLSGIGSRFCLIFFELDRVSGTAGDFVIRQLTSGGAILASVTVSGTNDWCRGIAFSNSMFNGGRKIIQAIGVNGTVTPFHVANYNSGTTAQVDQIQVLHTSANISGNIAVYAST